MPVISALRRVRVAARSFPSFRPGLSRSTVSTSVMVGEVKESNKHVSYHPEHHHALDPRLASEHAKEASHKGMWDFHEAAASGDIAAVKQCLANGADIFGTTHGDYYTALHCAAGYHPQRGGHRCHLDMIKFLISVGGYQLACMTTDVGNTALHIVASKGTYEAVVFLVGATSFDGMHAKNKAGLTPYGTAKAGRDFRHPGPAGGPAVLDLLGNEDKWEACIHDYMERVLHKDAMRVGKAIRNVVDEDGDGVITKEEWDHYSGHKARPELEGIETAQHLEARVESERDALVHKRYY